MHRSNLARASALALTLLVVPSACADSTEPASTTTTLAPATTASTGAAPSTTAAATTTTTEAARLIEVTYAGGQVAGGAQRATVARGEKVRIRVTSDVADEVHVHTYDVKAVVTPGQPAQLELVASIPGRHEVELERKRKQLLVLEVT